MEGPDGWGYALCPLGMDVLQNDIPFHEVHHSLALGGLVVRVIRSVFLLLAIGIRLLEVTLRKIHRAQRLFRVLCWDIYH